MDWKKLGLKAGLEIHQRLATPCKLFCNCSTTFSEHPAATVVKRHLRAVSGETGDVDIAAQHEFAASKLFVYKTYPQESCLVDTDSEPPHELNANALEIALEIALLLNCEIPDELHIMRKTVIDGSNTAGFQRTLIVGMNGSVQTSFGRVGITSVALEEESSKILGRSEGKMVFGLNRLGIPLVEIATDPDITIPEQGKELAEKLGMILRSSRVQRGLGSIRQDLNVSIASGSRVEIKGVQDLRAVRKLIEKEAARQLALVNTGKRVSGEVRKAESDASTRFLRPLPGAARMYPETDAIPITVSSVLLKKLRRNLPMLLEEKRQKLAKCAGIDTNTVKALEKSGKLEAFRKIAKLRNISTPFAADVLLSYPSEVQRRNRKADEKKIKERDVLEIFSMLNKKKISKDSVLDVLTDVSLGRKPDFRKYAAGDVDIESEVSELLRTKSGLTFSAYMGILMGRFRGRVSGDEIAKALKKLLK